jgi:two-component system invasion response regulator UvrY
MIRVVLVDDHTLVRSSLRLLLTQAGIAEILAEGASGEEALQLVRRWQPALLILDLDLPGLSGLEVTRRLVRQGSPTRVLILTMHADGPFPRRLLDAGARGYVSKGSPPEVLFEAVRRVAAGQRYVSPDIAQRLALQSFPDAGESPFDRLSERELEVALLSARGERGIDMAARLHLSPKTISAYRRRLMDKLGIQSDAELVRLAISHGLLSCAAKP